MQVTRRGFLKAGAIGGSVALGFDVSQARAEVREFKISRTTETRSICPYCAVSCGVIIHTIEDKPKNARGSFDPVEGDPIPPIPRGSLAPRGATLKGDIQHANRLVTPMVRKPGSDKWENIPGDEAISKIARHIKT